MDCRQFLDSLEDPPKIFLLADGNVQLVAAVAFPNGDATIHADHVALIRVDACMHITFI